MFHKLTNLTTTGEMYYFYQMFDCLICKGEYVRAVRNPRFNMEEPLDVLALRDFNNTYNLPCLHFSSSELLK